jgi:hypothetical protein
VLKKKIWANFQRIIELFTNKIVKKLLKTWSWDPGSEIRDLEKTYSGSRIPDPGVKKAPDPGSRIRIRNTVGKKKWIQIRIHMGTLINQVLDPDPYSEHRSRSQF